MFYRSEIKKIKTVIFSLSFILSLYLPCQLFGDIPISEPPKIIFYPKKTGKDKALIKGETCSGCEVFVKVEDRTFSQKADEKGFFDIEVQIEKNKENKISIYAQRAKRTSPPTQITINQYEILPPEPNSPPKVDIDSIPRYTNDSGVFVFGRAKPRSKVVIQGGSAKAEGFSDENGFFDILVFLRFDSLNELDVYYEDEQGFISPKTTFEIYQITKAPPTPKVQKIPEYTNQEKIKIKGRAVPGFRVVAELPTGSRIEYKADDENGNFEAEVSLIPNSENKISLYTVDFAGNFSAPERIVLYQDNIPPNPPEIILYPSQAYQDRITVLGKGEPETKVFAQILEKDYDVGNVDKVGNFIADVPILKFKRQVRRNYVNIYLEDKAGNNSSPALIVVDALPDIKQTNISINAGLHSFLGITSREFFDDLGKAPSDFAGLSAEIRYVRIFQRRSGPAMSIVGGFTTSFPREIDIPQLQDPSVKIIGNVDEVSKINLSTMYITLNMGIALFFEDFDIIPAVGIGGLGLIKSGPVLENGTILREDRLFLSYVLRTDFTIRYSLLENLSVYGNTSFSFSPVSNLNERGSSMDAGGLILGIGMSFGF
ncbi:MAG: hypothetical protein N2254_02750 [bacterium]|nr:hypothetical protein [bacterium]